MSRLIEFHPDLRMHPDNNRYPGFYAPPFGWILPIVPEGLVVSQLPMNFRTYSADTGEVVFRRMQRGKPVYSAKPTLEEAIIESLRYESRSEMVRKNWWEMDDDLPSPQEVVYREAENQLALEEAAVVRYAPATALLLIARGQFRAELEFLGQRLAAEGEELRKVLQQTSGVDGLSKVLVHGSELKLSNLENYLKNRDQDYLFRRFVSPYRSVATHIQTNLVISQGLLKTNQTERAVDLLNRVPDELTKLLPDQKIEFQQKAA